MDTRDQVPLCKYCHRPRTDVAPAWLAAQAAGVWHPVDGGGDLMYTARSLSGAGACPRCGATGGNIHVVKADVARSIARRLDPASERNE
jgi:hypothetical protein